MIGYDASNVVQKVAHLFAARPAVNLRFQIAKGVVAKRHGEIRELKQGGKGRTHNLARVFKQSAEFIQIMRLWKGHSNSTQPCFESLLHGLLDMKTEYLCREDTGNLASRRGPGSLFRPC